MPSQTALYFETFRLSNGRVKLQNPECKIQNVKLSTDYRSHPEYSGEDPAPKVGTTDYLLHTSEWYADFYDASQRRWIMITSPPELTTLDFCLSTLLFQL